ncbi:hypothetical protein [Amycolatopsis thermophila]|uniref:Uncharacterized protein n=1 Tax=Amycolatopsis thermophila TaxID=206084 RepID=A0ABU0F4D3_9PSEU|nr:hypothetical protein [Amycolatopsis thermophila]MDQ0382441.1 hypothetical protein [Amycolatopsis thermophila]
MSKWFEATASLHTPSAYEAHGLHWLEANKRISPEMRAARKALDEFRAAWPPPPSPESLGQLVVSEPTNPAAFGVIAFLANHSPEEIRNVWMAALSRADRPLCERLNDATHAAINATREERIADLRRKLEEMLPRLAELGAGLSANEFRSPSFTATRKAAAQFSELFDEYLPLHRAALAEGMRLVRRSTELQVRQVHPEHFFGPDGGLELDEQREEVAA